MTVELIYDRDCPNVLMARANLIKAIAASSREARWTEWGSSAANSPPHIMGYGSPTVLVDGKDVAENSVSGAGASCRLYQRCGVRFGGAPSVEEIVRAFASRRGASIAARDGWKSSLTAVPGIAFAFLPKVVCPACWPAYAGLLSALGLGFLLDETWLFPLTTAFLGLSIGALAFRARMRRNYGPFVFGLAASVVVLAGKFAFDSDAATYGGLAVLVAASIWNAWPRLRQAGCSACVPGSSSSNFFDSLKGDIIMTTKRKVEVFSAGCPACVETIELVNRVACPSCEVSILDMNQPAVAQRAKELGIRSVPTVVIDDKLADCCAGRGPQEAALRAAGLGQLA